MHLTVSANGITVAYALNRSGAASDLLAQLPLSSPVKDYGGIEKIFYPPQKLTTAHTPLVQQAMPGTLAYYAPWGNVVLFYGNFGAAAGLYELGHAVSGTDWIPRLQGTLRVEAHEE